MPPLYAYVGRQPIFDRNGKVVAYELLYRDSEANRAVFSDANVATAATMLNAVADLGLDRLVGNHAVYLNVTADVLTGTIPIPIPPDRAVLEVLETVPATPEVLAGIEELREEGYRIALDDFVPSDETRALIPLADIIKLDVLGVAREVVEARYAELRPLTSTLLAEKVSTQEEHAWLRGLGFDLFQGHYLQVPLVSRAKRLPHNRAALLQLLSMLYDPKLDVRSLEGMIAADVGLSVRLIKLASSTALSRGTPIGSLGQAILRVGIEKLAAFIVVSLVAGFDDKPFEIARHALIRARMCEALARTQAMPSEQLFTAGLLSLIDAILDLPLEDVLRQLPLTPLITGALRGTDPGPAAKIVEAARGQDLGDFGRVEATGISAQAIFLAWYEAVRWADELIASM